jgi:hypothetical protein
MTRWMRDRTLRHCGQCGQDIVAGDVFLRITFGSCQAKKYRCATCAGPAPPELLADLAALDPPPIRPMRFTGRPDYKAAQAGREEG